MSWFLLNRNLTLLEPYDWKLSCTVLRGERGSNAPDLPGRWKEGSMSYCHVLLGRQNGLQFVIFLGDGHLPWCIGSDRKE